MPNWLYGTTPAQDTAARQKETTAKEAWRIKFAAARKIKTDTGNWPEITHSDLGPWMEENIRAFAKRKGLTEDQFLSLSNARFPRELPAQPRGKAAQTQDTAPIRLIEALRNKREPNPADVKKVRQSHKHAGLSRIHRQELAALNFRFE